MKSVGRSVAVGAFWMIILKFAERGIGVVSTVILARLLMPEDFGLVAMAMAVFAFLEIAGRFGFDHALIRDSSVVRERYDTAWTMTICHGLVSALLLAIFANFVARFFGDPRLENVIYIMALMAAIQGFENIGIILFRKEMNFRKDFDFFLAKKIITFGFTIIFAVVFRSYWALVGGMFVSRTVGVILSYQMHSYRPRLSMKAVADLFGYSKWMLLNGVLQFVRGRGVDFIIGRFIGANGVGIFRVASEFATLPTTELMFPILRATYPGYAQVAHDRGALKKMFLTVQGTVLMFTLPAGIGIVLVADPFVKLVLGPNWLEVIPLIQVLGITSAIRVFQLSNSGIFNVLGIPYWNTGFHVLDIVAVLPLFAWMLYSGFDLNTAVWAYFGSSTLVVPFAMFMISRQLGLTFRERVISTWRPIVATGLMSASVWFVRDMLPLAESAAEAAVHLGILVPTGFVGYVTAMIALWYFSGRPDGPESRVLSILSRKMGGLAVR